VEGRCVGSTVIKYRENLTIEGVPPTPEGCPKEGPGTAGLLSTLKGEPGDDEVLRIYKSKNIVVRFLNIVDGRDNDGLEFKLSKYGVAHCNCVTRNDEGIELHGGRKLEVSKNLVFENSGDGIRARAGVNESTIVMNTSRDNGDDGIELAGSATEENVVTMNLVTGNARDGIELDDADLNEITVNEVSNNGVDQSRDSGIELNRGADQNLIDGNNIEGNADLLTDVIRCRSGNGNTGDNVTPACQ
jgi:parallel beta-helix repeat protein